MLEQERHGRASPNGSLIATTSTSVVVTARKYRSEERPPDPTEAVDANSYRHVFLQANERGLLDVRVARDIGTEQIARRNDADQAAVRFDKHVPHVVIQHLGRDFLNRGRRVAPDQ